MNITPDESLLALWLDDELHGEDFAKMEAWALSQPEQLAAREEVRSWRQSIAAAIPWDVEPPYPEFFNNRISKAIRELPAADHERIAESNRLKFSFWRSWVFPATALAGMALAFWVGTKANPTPAMTAATDDGPVPSYYTPEQGVNAEWLKSSASGATVIVLQGVNAIPDALDFSETVVVPTGRQDSTAEIAQPPSPPR